jgi:hypothetical protein
MPQQPQNRSNEAISTREHPRRRPLGSNVLASPNSIASKVLEKGKQVATPEIKKLAEARIFSHDPATFLILNEDSVPASGASLNVTPGTTIKSIGDVVQAFAILEQNNEFNRHIGSQNERARNKKMETDSPKAYQTLVNTSVDCMAKIAHVFHPADPEGMFRATVTAAAKKAQMTSSEDAVSALIERAQEVLPNLPKGSTEKRTACAIVSHVFGNYPEMKLTRLTPSVLMAIHVVSGCFICDVSLYVL